jgi:hypothetical protein
VPISLDFSSFLGNQNIFGDYLLQDIPPVIVIITNPPKIVANPSRNRQSG